MTRLLKVAADMGEVSPGVGAGDGPAVAGDLRIGNILVELGKLKSSQVDSVLIQQAANPRRFGDLAIAMGLLAQADIDLALMRQQAFTVEPVRRGNPDRHVLDLLSDDSEQAEVLRAVRSQLVLRWFGNDIEQRTLAIVSPDRRDGRTRVVSGLGVLLSQLDEPTLLIDADLRKPALHEVFGLPNEVGLTTALSQRRMQPSIQAVDRFENLYVLPSGPAVPNPPELLSKRQFGLLLEALAHRYAFIIIDTPPLQDSSEALTTAVRSSGCLLVARKHRSRMAQVQRLAATLTDHSVEVLGAVINDY